MSYTKEITIWCDSIDCGEWDQVSGSSISYVERLFKNCGWKKMVKYITALNVQKRIK